MKTRSMRIITLILAVVMLAAVFASCTDKPGNGPGHSGELKSDYQYVTDHKGATYRILNVADPLWSMVTCLDPEDTTDEVRHNIYTRNQKVKNYMNCDLDEQTGNGIEYQMNATLEESIRAGTEATKFNAAFMPLYHSNTMVPSGYYRCLNDIDTLKLDQDYWDQTMIETTSIEGKNYFVTGDVHMMAFESMWCLFFNKDMMNDMNMDLPYQLVKDGDWTFDKFTEYCKKAMNLNGDSSYSLDSENAIFGCVSFRDVISKMILGLGGDFVKKNNDEVVLNIEDKSFISVCQTIEEFLNTDGAFLMAADDIVKDKEHYYENYFTNNQCLFLGAEIKAAQGYRTSIQDWEFGIVPLPKNGTDDSYRSTSTYQTAALTVPSNNSDDEAKNVCNVIDALGFESDKMVIQPYFERTVEQKGLKDEESIDMLNIIRNNRTYDMGAAYNWTRKFEVELADMLENGDTNVSAKAKSMSDAVQSEIDKTLRWVEEQ